MKRRKIEWGLGRGARRQIIILVVAIFAFALNGLASDGIRHPPTIDTCDLCPVPGSVSCEIAPAACVECWDTCEEVPGTISNRRPFGPYNDPTVDYQLPRLLGVTQLAYDLNYERFSRLQQWTTKELLDDLDDHNIRAIKMWFAGDPFSDPWCWTTNWGYTHCYEAGTLEDMDQVWEHPNIDVYVVRFQNMAWAVDEAGCGPGTQVVFANEPTYDIARGLLERYGWMNKVIIIGDWEQDWQIKGRHCRGLDEEGRWLYPWDDPWTNTSWYSGECLDEYTFDECGLMMVAGRAEYVRSTVIRRQKAIQRARAEFPNAKLRVATATTISHGPWNTHPDDPGVITMAEVIASIPPKYQPDYVAVSFWSRNHPITLALDWVVEITGYPRYRIFIDELGEKRDADQYDHIYNNVTAAWCWGVDLVNIWMWKATWCGEVKPNGQHSYESLFYQYQPCKGFVEFAEPRPGYWALRDLIDKPFDFDQCE